MKKVVLLLLLMGVVAIGHYAITHPHAYSDVLTTARQVWPRNKASDEHAYKQTLLTLNAERKQLAQQPFNVNNASRVFIASLEEGVWPYWYGTLWSFNGTATTPNNGSIACGYFVTTTLAAMHVPVNRVAMAQMASEPMIRALVDKPYISHYPNASFTTFKQQLLAQGNALYIVGLDTHTGFILVNNHHAYMIHSGGGFPFQVVKQPIEHAQQLVRSKYRVLGRLDQNPAFLKRWIKAA